MRNMCVGAYVRRCVGYCGAAMLALLVTMGCAKPLVRASAKMMEPVVRSYPADPNQVYYAIRWALADRGYPVANENLPSGLITTAWRPTTADSHFLQPFRSRDYGTTGGYHQLELRVANEGAGRTRVEIISRLKNVIAYVQSSGRQETAVLDEIGHYLHSSDLGVTNVGVDE